MQYGATHSKPLIQPEIHEAVSTSWNFGFDSAQVEGAGLGLTQHLGLLVLHSGALVDFEVHVAIEKEAIFQTLLHALACKIIINLI